MPASPIRVALVGNPNAGKSTLFNALSGLRQHVGNYPGVTVDLKVGEFTIDSQTIEIIDLPGTYSLAARSPDEMVAVELLLGLRADQQPPDLIICVVDASNLERHLYLTTQVMELEKPVILAVNMMDLAEKQGMQIDIARLSAESGMTVIPLQAHRNLGLDLLRRAIVTAVVEPKLPVPPVMPEPVQRAIEQVREGLETQLPEFLARRALLDIGGSAEMGCQQTHGTDWTAKLMRCREEMQAAGCKIPVTEAKARYAYIRQVLKDAVKKPLSRPKTFSDRLDSILTHRIWGTLIFLGLMFGMFQALFVVAEPPMGWIESGITWMTEFVQGQMPSGPFRSLICDGILAGVGGVIVFVPQILILFAFIAVLEDCGYMSRAAFLMDRIMSRCGLSGKSFIPMLSSVACAVPGIMATRVIEDRRDRLATILVAPLMSCSARLPVYGVLIGAFLTRGQPFWLPGLTYFCMYMIGFIAAPIVALLLRRTVLKGQRSLFVMELPTYKRPSIKAVFRRVFDAGWAFIRRAGTLIFMSMILVWSVLYFPTQNSGGESYPQRIDDIAEKIESQPDDAEAIERWNQERFQLQGEWKRNSYLGQLGQGMEPVFAPLGWDWRIGVAALASFPAREVIVGTLAMIYDLESDDPEDETLQGTIREQWQKDPRHGRYAIPVAISVMVFFALCSQCASTLAVIRRETRTWFWPLFTFVYMTVLAYIAALVVFQVGAMLC